VTPFAAAGILRSPRGVGNRRPRLTVGPFMRRWRSTFIARRRWLADLAQLLIVASVAWWITIPLWRAHRAAGWRETRCTIVAIDYPDHRKVVTYAYVVDGQPLRARRTDFTHADDAGSWFALGDAEVGSARPCWYDPDDPSSAVLFRVGWAHDDFSELVFLLGAAAMVLLGWAGRRDDGGTLGWLALAPRALLVASLAVAAYAAPDGGRTSGDTFGLTVSALAAAAWVVVGAWRWARARRRLPAVRLRSPAGRPRSASARS
jgi:Protein of unknown function (DUF3592)